MVVEFRSASSFHLTQSQLTEVLERCLPQLSQGNPVKLSPLAGGALRLEVCVDEGSSRGPKLDRLFTAAEVMAWWGYSSLSAFWKMVRKEGVPTVELATHVVRFPESLLLAWVQRRTVGCDHHSVQA